MYSALKLPTNEKGRPKARPFFKHALFISSLSGIRPAIIRLRLRLSHFLKGFTRKGYPGVQEDHDGEAA